MTKLLPSSACVVAATLVLFGCKQEAAIKESPPVAGSQAPGVNGKAIAVEANEKGFVPASVAIKKGEPTTLVFTRTSKNTCATEVVFPDLKITKDLPYGMPVAVVLPVDSDREFSFQCGMAMMKGKAVVN